MPDGVRGPGTRILEGGGDGQMISIGTLADGRQLYYADENFKDPGYYTWDEGQQRHRRVAVTVDGDTPRMVPISPALRDMLGSQWSEAVQIKVEGEILVMRAVKLTPELEAVVDAARAWLKAEHGAGRPSHPTDKGAARLHDTLEMLDAVNAGTSSGVQH